MNPASDQAPGSPWWRAVNDSLLTDVRGICVGVRPTGTPRTAGAKATLEFIQAPTARSWYRAHNLSIVAAYLEKPEPCTQRSSIWCSSASCMHTRWLPSPGLALGWLAPYGRFLGDPRVGMTGIFLSLSRILPDQYPLEGDLSSYIDAEHSLGHLLDVGMIIPKTDPALRMVRSRARTPRPEPPSPIYKAPPLATPGTPTTSTPGAHHRRVLHEPHSALYLLAGPTAGKCAISHDDQAVTLQVVPAALDEPGHRR